jgi:Protein of unknown function (DUF3307)
MISALVGHLVGDYLLQNDYLALNKKKSTSACAIHCAIWTACVVMFAWWPWWTAIPLFVTHFIQDRTQVINWWMDFAGQKQFRTGACAPWSVIVVDNVWHVLTIWILWKVVGGWDDY